MKFLSEAKEADDEEEEEANNDDNPHRDDTESYDEEEYEGDHDNTSDEDVQNVSSQHNTPVSEKEEEVEALAVSSATTKPENAQPTSKRSQRSVKSAAAFMRNSAAFFRDEETLREMQRELLQEKKSLTHQVHTLTLQLSEKEQLSTALKAELQQLKTSATLASVMLQHKTAPDLSKGTTKPKTMAQWSERVFDQKLENQRLAEELLVLKTTVQDKQIAVQRKQQQRDEINAKLARVPRRHLCTLVDLQVEIARLLEEKRSLEAQSPRPFSPGNDETQAMVKSGAFTKSKLQNELTSLEITAERYREELRQWELKIDCEQARSAPMETRLASLQQELRQYEDSQVLLRSVFLRLGPDASDGCVPLEAALAAFQTLTPSDQSVLSTEEMSSRLSERNIISSLDGGRFSFSQFAEAFTSLFNT
ncbi:hypothetical protein PHYBOEH_005053 [Phytophthora boehmeriae]|uniref:Uncharacterized protein n=1 Tax=Phytophthora boehmeriae TaxID=109152 RepID=A0A8T1WQA4_9STRA|nr:hypothetical protein PHYBOEH_005053 [Phytophthora boehmeriae]